MISIIAVFGKGNIIKKKKYIHWKIKENIKWFEKNTINKIIIMDKKIWKYVKKPFKKRINIIIDNKNKKSNYFLNKNKKLIFTNSIIKALNIAKKNNKEIIIIGGKKIYLKTYKWSTKIYLTYINKEIYKNKFFPKHSFKEWKIIYRKKKNIKNNNINYIIFNIYTKI